jgi:hypothetical protein
MQVEEFLRIWQRRPWEIQFIPVGKGQFQVAQYRTSSLDAAKEKLLQFPTGSSFRLLGDLRQEGEEKAFQDLSEFVAAHGMSLTRDNGAGR